MRWENLRPSRNVEDRRAQRGSRRSRPPMAMGGCGLVLMLVAALVFGVNPLEFLGQSGLSTQPSQNIPASTSAESNELAEFTARILGSTEEEWTDIFKTAGRQYRLPKLVNYSGSTRMRSGGVAQAASGPFYIPTEETVYLDTQFFYQLKQMSQDRSGDYDFAPAYVIAHEVAHHVQNLLGYTDFVHKSKGRVSEREYNQLSVRLELQADFLAGVWAHHANRRMQQQHGVSLLEEGDIQEAMRAAKAIGDDAFQRQSSGRIRPDSFTHGTSDQRLRWFTKGLKTGDITQGDTFSINYQNL